MKKYFVFLVLLSLILLTSCSREKLEIVEENVANNYISLLGDNTVFKQLIDTNAKLVEKEQKEYVRIETKISKFKIADDFLSFYYSNGKDYEVKPNIINENDYGCAYFDIELNDSSYYIYDVGYSIINGGEKVFDEIFIPSKNDSSKFSYSKKLDVDFRSNFRWEINEVLFNNKEFIMFYVDIISDKKFDKDFIFEVYTTNGIMNPKVYYTNNDKRIYILLDKNEVYEELKLRYQFVKIDLFYGLYTR